MFGLFEKKPEPQQAEETKPYEPEKPVRELFEAVKDRADSFIHEGEQWKYRALRFEINGKRFGAVCPSWAFRSWLITSGDFDPEEFDWMDSRELSWLCARLSERLFEQDKKRKQKKRQEFIDALCPDSST